MIMIMILIIIIIIIRSPYLLLLFKKYPMYILLVYERELSKNDYPKTLTNNNYKKHQKVNKKK